MNFPYLRLRISLLTIFFCSNFFPPFPVPRPLCAVRMMLPFTVNCNKCGDWIYKGKKFNSRMEEVPEDKYLSIRVWRFYYKCTNCSAECAFKTDPKNSDYIAEFGASRNNEPWRDNAAKEVCLRARPNETAVFALVPPCVSHPVTKPCFHSMFVSVQAEFNRKKEEEERDVMRKLENRTADSKRELEIMDCIEEIREINAKRANCAYHHHSLDRSLLWCPSSVRFSPNPWFLLWCFLFFRPFPYSLSSATNHRQSIRTR